MIDIKIIASIAWCAGFWLEIESACEEAAILSKRLDRRFLNKTISVNTVSDFEDEIFGKNILCTNISQSLELEIRSPTRRKVSKYNGWGYWVHEEENEVDIPCRGFTIVNSTIPILPTSFLSSYSDVVMLDLRNAHIKTIKPGAFKELTKLERLHLDGNEISVITAIFYSINKLQMLTLSNNNITAVDFDTVSLLVDLNYLDLSGNPIEQIPNSDNFVPSNLQTLLLNNTLIREFNVNFAKKLQILNLSSDDLTDGDFSSYPNAETLTLSHNQINSTVNCEFSLSDWIYLNHNNLSDFSCINNNVVSFINLSNNELETITVRRSEKLQILDVSFNSIKTIGNDSFEGTVALRYLFLQNNLLTTVRIDAFRDLNALIHLDLSSNKIQQFQSGTFNSLANLEYLNIQRNQIKSIFQLNALIKLDELHADHNEIKFNVTDLKLYFRLLKLVSFSHNPWSCEDLVKTYHELSAIGVVVAKGDSLVVDNLHGIACNDSAETAPADFRGTHSVKTVSDENIEQFLNFDFYKSKFYKYFDEDYAKSNFFSYLRNYKFVVGDNVGAGNNKTENAKLTSLVVKPESGGAAGALIILNLMLAIVVILLSCIVYLLYKMFMKNMLRNNHEAISMQEELIM